jgi:hypothetical protein
LVNIGVPEEDARIYEDNVKRGAILVAVPAMNSEHREANAILRENGAEQVKAVDTRESQVTSEVHTAAQI